MLKIKALDIAWLCEQCEKLKSIVSDSDAPEKVVRKELEAMKKVWCGCCEVDQQNSIDC